jgi:nitrite reductase/ring-hydroxylating ferredoxin subunit
MDAKNTKIKFFLITGSLILCCLNCKKDNTQPIPYISVNLTLSANELLAIPLGSTKSYAGGNDSLYIYHADISSYNAYDRLCTNYPNDTSAVVTDVPGGATATCPRCKSKFELIFGSVIQGPAKYPLKQYQTNYYGGRLYVTN